jgi:NAD(P)-dependent dehydrogenase (short-subunit alcohol dehydrogenase family)
LLEIGVGDIAGPAGVRFAPSAGMRFSDRVCVVTGAGSGIGRAIAERCGAEGGRVAVVDRDAASGQATVDLIRGKGGDAMFAEADVGDRDAVRSAVDRIMRRFSRIDVLVNNAAMMTFQPIVDLPEDDWDRLMNVNLRSMFLFCKYAVPHMPRGSAIVNISSVHAHETTKTVVPYAASKGAIEAFTRGFSEEAAAGGIRVNCVAPGAVNTPMLWNNPAVRNGIEKVKGAVGEPKDIAAVVCFLASPEARFITGTTVVADGGRLDIL